jgi:predicted nicotinamide N-methyase
MDQLPSQDLIDEIVANTMLGHCPLVPEIQLRLLNFQGPWCDAGSHIFAENGPQPYWAFAWGSGQITARYLLDHPHVVAGKRVFDFGAGSGIAGIAAALSGATLVTANDVDPRSLAAIRLNAELNDTHVEVCSANVVQTEIPNVDVLLASDAFFHWPGNEGVIFQQKELETILVAVPNRRGLAPGREFPLRQMKELVTYDVRTVPEIEMDHIRSATLYEYHPFT